MLVTQFQVMSILEVFVLGFVVRIFRSRWSRFFFAWEGYEDQSLGFRT